MPRAPRRRIVEEAVTPSTSPGRLALDRHPGRQDAVGEREKLLDMETNLKRRVVGQDEAVVAVSNAIRAPGLGCRTRTGDRLVPVPGPDASARPS